MLRIERHSHEQRCQERKDIGLQERNEEFQQTQGHVAEDARNGYRSPQRKTGRSRHVDESQDSRQHQMASEHVGEQPDRQDDCFDSRPE